MMINLENVILALSNKPKNDICCITDDNYTSFSNWYYLIRHISKILPEIHLSFFGSNIIDKLSSILGWENEGSGFDYKNYVLYVDGKECEFIYEHAGEENRTAIIIKDTGEEYTPHSRSYAWGIIKRIMDYSIVG